MPVYNLDSEIKILSPFIRSSYENLRLSFRKEIYLYLNFLNLTAEKRYNYLIPHTKELLNEYLYKSLEPEYSDLCRINPDLEKSNFLFLDGDTISECVTSNIQKVINLMNFPVVLHSTCKRNNIKFDVEGLEKYYRYWSYINCGITTQKLKDNTKIKHAIKELIAALFLENQYQIYCLKKMESYGNSCHNLKDIYNNKPPIALDLNLEPYFNYFEKIHNEFENYSSLQKQYPREYLGKHFYVKIDQSSVNLYFKRKLRYFREDFENEGILLSHNLNRKICLMCGRKFRSTKKAKFCCDKCKTMYHYKKRKETKLKESKERVCPICGKPIFGRTDKKTCSNACKMALYRKNK